MVKRVVYTPDRGDVVWMDFNPQKGHEQAHRRPAIVLSPQAYNKKSGLALVCPITAHAKGYPFEIVFQDKKVRGAILTDQIRSIDWQARKIVFIQKSTQGLLVRVQERIVQLLTE